MNELVDQFLVDPCNVYELPDRLGQVAFLEANDLVQTINEVFKIENLQELGMQNRSAFLRDDADFRSRFHHYLHQL